MKTISKFLATKATYVLLFSLFFCSIAYAQSGPETGTYYIVNAATGRALTPVDAGVHSNTRLKAFTKSGMQKWEVTKAKTSASYTIKNVSSGFFLRPHHVPDNGNAILATKDAYCSFSIHQEGKNYIIKNNKMGGDVMFSKNTGFSDDEPWFGADEGSGNARWKLIPVK